MPEWGTDIHAHVGRRRLRVRAFGSVDAPDLPVLLIHGLGIAGAYFAPLANELARTHYVLAPDLTGHGASSKHRHVLDERQHADVLMHVVDQLLAQHPSILVVGHSWGCPITLELCRAHPERFPAAVLLAPALDELHESLPSQLARLVLMGARQPLRLNLLQAFEYSRTGPRRTYVEFRNGQRHRTLEAVQAVRQSLLLARGERDPLVSQEWIEQLAAGAHRPAVATFREAGHVINWWPAAELAAAIDHFCERAINR